MAFRHPQKARAATTRGRTAGAIVGRTPPSCHEIVFYEFSRLLPAASPVGGIYEILEAGILRLLVRNHGKGPPDRARLMERQGPRKTPRKVGIGRPCAS
jgi:hypothetical protein